MSGLELQDKAAWLSLPVIHIPAQKSPPHLSLSLRASLPVSIPRIALCSLPADFLSRRAGAPTPGAGTWILLFALRRLHLEQDLANSNAQ